MALEVRYEFSWEPIRSLAENALRAMFSDDDEDLKF